MEIASSENNFYYNKSLKNKARNLRNNSTLSESIMWRDILKRKNMMDFQFYRQRPVLNFIVDFICFDLLLIIEVEGEIHNVEPVYKKDARRKQKLKEVGFNILYFQNKEILYELEIVRLSIENWINEYIKK